MNNTVTLLDSYSILIISKYFMYEQDFINIVCVCKKFKETTKKLRYNPIPITSLKLFPKLQTQFLYSPTDVMIVGILRFEIWYYVDYDTLVKYKDYKDYDFKFHHVKYTSQNREQYGNSIPSLVNMLDVHCFYKRFEDCNIETITIPNYVTSIGSRCFLNCSKLKSVVLSTSLRILSDGTFSQCKSLKSITIPSSIQSFGNYCFCGCQNMKTIPIPDYLTQISYGCFSSCYSLQSITLPQNIVAIEDYTFWRCSSLTNITFPQSLHSIGNYCFSYCTSLSEISFPTSLKKIGKYCFLNCQNLTIINGCDGVSIGDGCFNTNSIMKH
ncbi:Leucine rich repeat containing protein BspA family protein [Entamoeba marina]